MFDKYYLTFLMTFPSLNISFLRFSHGPDRSAGHCAGAGPGPRQRQWEDGGDLSGLLGSGEGEGAGLHGTRRRGPGQGPQPHQEAPAPQVQEARRPAGGDQPGEDQHQTGRGREATLSGEWDSSKKEKYIMLVWISQIIQERAKSARSSSARMRSLPIVKGHYQSRVESAIESHPEVYEELNVM